MSRCHCETWEPGLWACLSGSTIFPRAQSRLISSFCDVHALWRVLALLLLALVSAPSLTCGSSARHLQSIAISKMANGTQIEFAATGTFSSSPTTVNPLAVNWSMGLIAPPPAQYRYALTPQPFVVNCTDFEAGPVVVSAVARLDLNAPSSRTLPMSDMLASASSATCP
jgi:hypothetical protein